MSELTPLKRELIDLAFEHMTCDPAECEPCVQSAVVAVLDRMSRHFRMVPAELQGAGPETVLEYVRQELRNPGDSQSRGKA